MAVFRIESHVNYVEADNRRTALTYARKVTTAHELSSREIVALEKAGKSIIDAATGQVCNADDEGASAGGNVRATPVSQTTGD